MRGALEPLADVVLHALRRVLLVVQRLLDVHAVRPVVLDLEQQHLQDLRVVRALLLDAQLHELVPLALLEPHRLLDAADLLRAVPPVPAVIAVLQTVLALRRSDRRQDCSQVRKSARGRGKIVDYEDRRATNTEPECSRRGAESDKCPSGRRIR